MTMELERQVNHPSALKNFLGLVGELRTIHSTKPHTTGRGDRLLRARDLAYDIIDADPLEKKDLENQLGTLLRKGPDYVRAHKFVHAMNILRNNQQPRQANTPNK